MTTNFVRLLNTVRYVEKIWQAERRCQEKNAVHEGAWSMQVIEPVLAALEWPRLRRDGLKSSGAYFEWPAKHCVDVALLEEGRPRAYLELKGGRWGPAKRRNDLLCKLNRYPPLGNARFGVASWFVEDAGFFEVYEIGPAFALTPSPVLNFTFAEACDDPSPLAHLAAPLLTCEITDANVWLNATIADVGPFVPRCSTRDVQRKFFTLLAKKLGINSLQPRHRCTNWDPPSPSYAYVDLPGVLPVGWGLVLDIDTTMNQLQCFFYRNSDTKICKTQKWSFDDSGDLSDEAIDLFLENMVIPIIELRKLEALASGRVDASRLPKIGR